jgi:hypothetical protein
LQRLQKQVLKKIEACFISNILSIMLFTRYYNKYSKVKEAKETVDLKMWHHKHVLFGESNGKLPLRTFPECSVPEPYRSPDWALVPAKTGPRTE